MSMREFMKFTGLAIPFLVLLTLSGDFYGFQNFHTLSVHIFFLTNSMVYLGASFPFFPFFGRDYRNVWEMVLRRALIPVIASPISILAITFTLAFSVRHFLGHPMNEAEMALLAFLNLNIFVVMAFLRAFAEIKVKGNWKFRLSVYDIFAMISLFIASLSTTPYFFHAGDAIAAESMGYGMNWLFVSLLRHLLRSIPPAMFSVPYIMMLNADRIRLQ